MYALIRPLLFALPPETAHHLGLAAARWLPRSGADDPILATHVAGTTPQRVSYAALEAAPAVLLAGFEPEEETPIVFLRLRKGMRKHGSKVVAVAPFLSQGAAKLGALLVPTKPGAEAAALSSLDTAVTTAMCRAPRASTGPMLCAFSPPMQVKGMVNDGAIASIASGPSAPQATCFVCVA